MVFVPTPDSITHTTYDVPDSHPTIGFLRGRLFHVRSFSSNQRATRSIPTSSVPVRLRVFFGGCATRIEQEAAGTGIFFGSSSVLALPDSQGKSHRIIGVVRKDSWLQRGRIEVEAPQETNGCKSKMLERFLGNVFGFFRISQKCVRLHSIPGSFPKEPRG